VIEPIDDRLVELVVSIYLAGCSVVLWLAGIALWLIYQRRKKWTERQF
jgi:hypothetical protein